VVKDAAVKAIPKTTGNTTQKGITNNNTIQGSRSTRDGQ